MIGSFWSLLRDIFTGIWIFAQLIFKIFQVWLFYFRIFKMLTPANQHWWFHFVAGTFNYRSSFYVRLEVVKLEGLRHTSEEEGNTNKVVGSPILSLGHCLICVRYALTISSGFPVFLISCWSTSDRSVRCMTSHIWRPLLCYLQCIASASF